MTKKVGKKRSQASWDLYPTYHPPIKGFGKGITSVWTTSQREKERRGLLLPRCLFHLLHLSLPFQKLTLANQSNVPWLQVGPLHCLVQEQDPSIWLQLAPFWHWHLSWQPLPWRPCAQAVYVHKPNNQHWMEIKIILLAFNFFFEQSTTKCISNSLLTEAHVILSMAPTAKSWIPPPRTKAHYSNHGETSLANKNLSSRTGAENHCAAGWADKKRSKYHNIIQTDCICTVFW